ncbi:MAG: carbon storage regulator [Paenibacillus sp.]|nr:carbon storage regulator [Paenibacillus sp.]
MLVVGRKPGEYVVINGNIIVKVVKSEEGHLRLAIDAPQTINILRGEMLEKNPIGKFADGDQTSNRYN